MHALYFFRRQIKLSGVRAEILKLEILDLFFERPIHDLDLLAVHLELIKVGLSILLILLHLGHGGV